MYYSTYKCFYNKGFAHRCRSREPNFLFFTYYLLYTIRFNSILQSFSAHPCGALLLSLNRVLPFFRLKKDCTRQSSLCSLYFSILHQLLQSPSDSPMLRMYDRQLLKNCLHCHADHPYPFCLRKCLQKSPA